MNRSSIFKLVLAVATVAVVFGVGASVAWSDAAGTFCGAPTQPACDPSTRGILPVNALLNRGCPEGTTQVEFNQTALNGPQPVTIGNVTLTVTGANTTTASGHASFTVSGGLVAAQANLHGGGGGTGVNSTNQYIYTGFIAGGVISDGNLHWPGPRSNVFICLVSPLAVSAQSFKGTRVGKVVTLRWRTASEFNVLGFNVYRAVKGKRAKLNKRLVPAASVISGKSTSAYAFRARLASKRLAATSRFYLQEVHTNGSRTWYGPVRARNAA